MCGFLLQVIVVNVKIMFETFSWIRWTVVSFAITYLAWYAAPSLCFFFQAAEHLMNACCTA